jgi:apolipoprotein N-acyltransferase
MGAVVGDRENDGWYNRAIVWSADGRAGRYYDKTHPVPFGEYIPLRSWLEPRVSALEQIPTDMIRGTRPGVLQVGRARAGALMCFEVAYDGLLRDVVRGGADVIVVPTNNATYTGTGQIEQQFAMSRLRAIETGRYVVVASTNGISGIVAPDGHVVAQAPQRRQVVLEQRVALLHRLTPAVRLGAWPELILSALAVLALALSLLTPAALRRYSRRSGAGREPEPLDDAAPAPQPTGSGARR